MSGTLTTPPPGFHPDSISGNVSLSSVSRAVSLRTALAVKGADYLQLIKPRISLMVLLTVSAGFYLGASGMWNSQKLGLALVGIALVASGSSALNQYLERRSDARMSRTADRPLPSGRMQTVEVLWFGIGSAVCGTLWLAWYVNILTALLTLATLLLYVLAYTPLKRYTTLGVAVGAIPGALPPVLGWVAADGELNCSALSLFGMLFLWQFPHFLAIAWLYQEQYRSAGLRMLPGAGRMQGLAGLLATAYALVLVPVSLLPAVNGLAGRGFAWVALALGGMYVAAAMRFAAQETRTTARLLLGVSLFYLPLLLLALVGDHWRLLS